MDIYALQREDRRAEAADERARLRRRRQLLARRPVDRLLLDARRLRPHAQRRRDRSSSTRTRATSPRSTSCSADGSGQTRLTTRTGYDGGPFFTPDGKRIVWRRFDEQGLIADVWTMKPDGTDQRQITDFGSMSWAPYVHPSGEYILFASNKLGFENFEVFMVDTAGTKEPVRVTYSDGFDGLPVPSPDGKQLAWTSSRAGGRSRASLSGAVEPREGARGAAEARRRRSKPKPEDHRRRAAKLHEHTATRLAIAASLPCVLALSAVAGADAPRAVQSNDAAARRDAGVRRARGPARRDSHGERLAGDYIVSRAEQIGAKPLPGQTDFRVPFEFTAGTRTAARRSRSTHGAAAASQVVQRRGRRAALSVLRQRRGERPGRVRRLRHRRARSRRTSATTATRRST